ncbi:MAG: M28 family peptidase, partial [Anaerolineales bacterium]
ATQAEARAADHVSERLSALGIPDVHQQVFTGLRSIWLFLALSFGFALSGHAAFWLLRRPLGDVAAWVLSATAFAMAAYLMWRKFSFRDYPLRASLPHGPSQNVLASLSPVGDLQRQVVFIAHLDSHRAVFWFASDLLVAIYAFVSPLAVYGLALAPLAYGLAAISGLAVLGWLGLAFAVLHFAAWFSGMTADVGPFSPGANDNASSVGLALSLAERLTDQPLERTQVWLAFTGCEESGCDGMLAFLDKYGDQLSDALFVDFELVGIGERLAYLQSEGVVRRRRISPDVENLLQRIGAQHALQPISAASFGAFTETGVVWERGYRGVTLLALRQGKPYLPEWHRMTDSIDRLQSGTLGRVHALAWALLQEIDS